MWQSTVFKSSKHLPENLEELKCEKLWKMWNWECKLLYLESIDLKNRAYLRPVSMPLAPFPKQYNSNVNGEFLLQS